MNSKNPRLLAVKALTRVSDGAYSNLQVNNIIQRSEMDPRDVSLFTNIVYGVIQHRITLEYYVENLVKNTKKLDNWVKELLYTAIYQIKYLDKIPDRAIFNESINIAKKLGHDGTRKLVTGVLHHIQRDGLPSLDKINDNFEKLSIQYSVPTWLIEKFAHDFGNEKMITILNSINDNSNQSIRVNTSKISMTDLKAKLVEEGFEVEESKVADNALILTKKPAIHSQYFELGLFTIQDESAMLPVQSMNLTPGEVILDACAAPGGKTTQIAEYISPSGRIEALDLHEKKLKLIKNNAKRMGLNELINLNALDARKIDEVYDSESFDQILVDAPCSGLGLMRRKPEIRYEKSIDDINRLSKIQLEILSSISDKVKHGGVITYSTCTVTPEENVNVINQFLNVNPDFESQRVSTRKGINDNREEDYLAIYPDDFNSDGFFVAQLKRR
ncbi:16S rRNA (cytosine(967)-C(5))-methyltransferase RsmB [Lactobacillus sp. S2-2]|uniref:16S rRNA (cytosine(967)-C(5))-methyltransferase RsmB n=1 Tax=Lactobacillus sp. S2-2 TaxID=2692917 RepID=UPI001F00065B|nr:16S rRNA (cytosine(967)-C(5))-methyltransferase RsmB [Lactobacillus sp. S2-2]MCF6515098.1 16S rRNA (cytosine(967)-C(5))-methyltransferase RsmB [Lactobacillus sp. S2-2]